MTKSKIWIANLNLLESDKNLILDTTAWITDSIVNAAQKLLKEQFPGINGLQNVCMGYVMGFEIQAGAFLQILHSNNHWLTIASGQHQPSVKVFDSLNSYISTLVKAQIACILSTQKDKISFSIMDVQTQVCHP